MPVVRVRVSPPDGVNAATIPMIVDTGSDRTLLPASVVRELGLPRVTAVKVKGIGEAEIEATIHGAVVAFGRFRSLVRVIAFLDEALLGRDVLNQLVTTLDGPERTLSFEATSRAPRRSRPR
jgi:predicted aspartyl protease